MTSVNRNSFLFFHSHLGKKKIVQVKNKRWINEIKGNQEERTLN